MSKPLTVREWTAYIYDKLTISERTGSWVAEGLQKIEVEYEQQDRRIARLQDAVEAAIHGHANDTWLDFYALVEGCQKHGDIPK